MNIIRVNHAINEVLSLKEVLGLSAVDCSLLAICLKGEWYEEDFCEEHFDFVGYLRKTKSLYSDSLDDVSGRTATEYGRIITAVGRALKDPNLQVRARELSNKYYDTFIEFCNNPPNEDALKRKEAIAGLFVLYQ